MLLHHLQTVLKDSCIEIVEDNAKSHPTKGQTTPRRGSMPTYVITSPRSRRRSLKRMNSHPSKPASRWESETIAHTTDPTSANSPQTTSFDGSIGHTVLSKPVRRQSIEDPDVLAQLQGSVSSLDGVNGASKDTAALLASALASIDSYEEEISTLLMSLDNGC